MPRLIKKGSLNVASYFFITDSTAFTPEVGITVTVLDMQYVRSLTAPSVKVDAIVSDADLTTHVDDKIVEVDATDQAGLYMACFPDAAFATGASGVILSVTGAGFHPVHMEIQLVDFDPEDAVRMGQTALPDANADAAGGVVISDAGGLDIDTKLANTNEVTVARMGALTDWIDGGRLDLLLDLIKAITDRQAKFMVPGAVVAGTLTTTKMSTDLTPTVTNQYTNRTLTFLDDTTSAGLQGVQTYITVTDTNGDVTFTAIPIAPAAADTFEIT